MKLTPDINNITSLNKGTWSINDQVSINFYPTENSGGKGGWSVLSDPVSPWILLNVFL